MLRNSNRTIKALLLMSALLLSALALVGGCKSSSSKTGSKAEPENGYLYFNDDSVRFVEWRRTGLEIKGSIEEWDRKPDGEVELTVFMFDGALDGENVNITLNSSMTNELDSKEMRKAIAGALRGNTLTLSLVDGAAPIEFRRASAAEYSAAYRNLQMRATTKKGAK
jgi:hypothetical protein